MGTGIATVAGFENEPLPHCANIEEAQAELRQELADRNERQRELEFLEKGGDPLEFNFGEAATGLWSLPPPDPLVKHLLPSDERVSISALSQQREGNGESDLEYGSECKRARSLSGKFLYLGNSAIHVSVENPSIIPCNEDDGKDAAKKEIDAFKSNKVAVKGQYARRNRQRSNRFGNGTAGFRDPVKTGTDSGSLNSIVPGPLVRNAEGKHGIVQTGHAGDVARQQSYLTSEGDDVAANRAETAMLAPASANHDLPVKSIVQPRNADLAKTTLKIEVGALQQRQNEGQESMGRLPSSPGCVVEGARDLPLSPLPIEAAPKVCSPSAAAGDAQAEHSVREGSTRELSTVSGSKGTKQAMDTSLEMAAYVLDDGCKKDMFHNSQTDTGISPIEHSDMTMTLILSECGGLDKGTSSTAVNLAVLSTSDSHDSDRKGDTSNNNINGLSIKSGDPEDVEVKVEEETSEMSLSDARPLGVSKATRVHGILTSCVVPEGVEARVTNANGLPADKGPAVSQLPLEKIDRDVADNGKTDLSIIAMKVDTQESEGVKAGEPPPEALKKSADQSKRTAFQEPPRKRSHWDYVLEEMAWMANDFMQERLWKTAAAAHVARWIAKSKQQLEFDAMELRNRQSKIAQSLAKQVKTFWHMVEALLHKEAQKVAAGGRDTADSTVVEPKARPVHAYAMRFLKDTPGQQVPQAEAPLTPDRASESGLFDFLWEEQFPEESLIYTVPHNAMEIYRQSVASQWEREYEQRLQEHEAALAEADRSAAAEVTEYSSGAYATGTFISPLLMGKRNSGYVGGNQGHLGSIPTKRRTSAVAGRQRAAGGMGPLVSIPVAHITRSDMSSCETNSQQDEITTLLEGSSISGRATDADSNGVLARNNTAADGVDSPFKRKKKKKTRHFSSSVRDPEHLWQHSSHRRSEQKDHSKQKGEHGSDMLEGLGASMGAYHGATSGASSASKLMKQIASRDRGRKYKGLKGSLNQPGFGLPWSPAEDQAILGLVYELGTNWELVSDILSSHSQLKGIFRRPKDCKERYKMLTDRSGGDGGGSPDDPSSSAYFPNSLMQKGGTRLLPQHLEETLRTHIEGILHLHQQLHSKKQQMEPHEPKQLVAEHESHAIKHTTMTPLELCERSSTSGEVASHSYPLQLSHGNGLGIPSLLSSGMGMRPTSSSMAALPGSNSLSPSMSPSAAINAAATRDAQRMGVSMRSYNRMMAGRGLPTQGLAMASSSPLMSMPNATDCIAPSSGTGMVGGLNRSMAVARTDLPGMGPLGAPNLSTGVSSALVSGLLGAAGAVNISVSSSPLSMARRPGEVMAMGQVSSQALNNSNNNLPSLVVSSPTQNHQQQLMQHGGPQPQQQSPSSSQQQAYNMMRAAKERQQLQQQQQQKQKLLQQQQQQQQQPSPTSNSLLSSPPTPQQQHTTSHGHLFPQNHQPPPHLIMQQHMVPQEPGPHGVTSSSITQSMVSPSGQPSQRSSGQISPSLSQLHQLSSMPSSSMQPSCQVKQQHHSLSIKQQAQQPGGKTMKGRCVPLEVQSNMFPSQLCTQSTSEGAVLCAPLVPNIAVNMPQVTDVGVQQLQQKGFLQPPSGVKQRPQPQAIPSNPFIQPSAPSTAASAPQPPSLALSQQGRGGQPSQSQQRRPQEPPPGGLNQLVSPLGKNGMQASGPIPSPLPVSFQLGTNTNMGSPSSGVPLSSASSGSFPSQWKGGQSYSPMTAGLYNLSRSNSGIAAQAPHLAMSVGMHLPSPGSRTLVSSNTMLAAQDSSSRVGSHAGSVPQKASMDLSLNSRALTPVSPHLRQLTQQQQLPCASSSTGGLQARPSSGTAPGSE